MPDSLLLHPPLVFTRHDNMEVILRGNTYTTNPKEGAISRNGKYIGQVKQGSADKGVVLLTLSLLDNNYLRVNFIGDPKSAIVNIGVGSLLMYTAVLTARLNFASYILVHYPVTSALGWYFKLGFYPDPVMAHENDGDSKNQRAIHDCDLFGNVNLIPSKQTIDSDFAIRFACTRTPFYLKGNVDIIEATSRECMHKKGWSLSDEPDRRRYCTLL